MTELREKLNNIVEEKNTKVTPENLRVGAEAFGVQGTFTADADATAEDIASGKTAYVNGEKITGVLEISGGDETSFMSAVDSSLGANVTHLPDGTTSLRTNIFQNCTNLALTKLPPKISNLGAYCFQNCSNLLISEFPTTQKISFGAYAFAGCSNITIKELGPNLGLNTDCFYQCLGITEITHRAQNLPVRIFSGCKNLKKFILPDVTSVIRLANTNVFAQTGLSSEDGGIYVPDNLVEDYKVATNWSKWADYIKGLSELEV